MAKISRYDPLTALVSPFEDFDEMFRGFFQPVRVEHNANSSKTASLFRVDLSEKDSEFLIEADLPGIKKEDIHVVIDGNQVTINAEIKSRKEEGWKKLYSERNEGSVFRSLRLPEEIDDSKAQAKFEDGVLKLTLPKMQQSIARQITIQ
ncbi:MAG: Hsp20/alpha crystallin family protein [Proteobacteria bacterium]|nr:Hsp20/alpha crystallin family protein [Pseudomonadota bacterium]MDE3208147.1 Hsp20/alpha crystallin family protein [Pseudomonadota bacterium]